jgi:hypothetical protein
MTMPHYDITNKGAIWTNSRKQSDTHPDFTGSLNVEGKEYYVSAWRKEPNGDRSPVLSFSIKAKDAVNEPNTTKEIEDVPF